MNQTESSLTTTEFHIMLALRDSSLHGYQIIKQIDQDTDGAVKLLTGTLYNAIKRLAASELIQETEGDVSQDSRRKYYQLTEKGRRALGIELQRYENAVKLISSRRFVGMVHYV